MAAAAPFWAPPSCGQAAFCPSPPALALLAVREASCVGGGKPGWLNNRPALWMPHRHSCPPMRKPALEVLQRLSDPAMHQPMSDAWTEGE